jgi:chromosome partitioning protein
MVGEEMKTARERRGWAQQDLASWLNEQLGRRYDRQKISRWESGAERIPKQVSDLLAEGQSGVFAKAVEQESAVSDAGTAAHGPALVVAIANQKGGVAKTATAVNLAHLLDTMSMRVLVIDADPQASATIHLGLSPRDMMHAGRTLASVFSADRPLLDCVQPITTSGVMLIPSSLDLAKTETDLLSEPLAALALRERLVEARAQFDVILIDCPPNLGMMATNAFGAADAILVPCQTELLAIEGIDYLLETVTKIRRRGNPILEILGILPTLYSARNSQDRASLADIHERFSDRLPIFPPVPRATVYAQAVAAGRPAVEADPRAPGADVYREVAKSIIAARQAHLEAVNGKAA